MEKFLESLLLIFKKNDKTFHVINNDFRKNLVSRMK